MPNWCNNVINTEDYNVIAALCNDDGKVDFNKIIERPKEYDDYDCGSGKEFALYVYYSNKGTMEFIGHKEWNTAYFKEHLETLSKERIETIYQIGSGYDNLYQKYGYYDWCDWSKAKWGCKWNATNSHISETGPVYTAIFDTPWCDPEHVYEELFKMFPDSQIKIICRYEGDGYRICTNDHGRMEIEYGDGECDDYGCPLLGNLPLEWEE